MQLQEQAQIVQVAYDLRHLFAHGSSDRIGRRRNTEWGETMKKNKNLKIKTGLKAGDVEPSPFKIIVPIFKPPIFNPPTGP